MRSKFRLELDVVLDTDRVANVIEAARKCFATGGTATAVDEHGGSRTLSAQEFIDGIEDALMELLERNPLLANANVEIERVVCSSASVSPNAGTSATDGNPFGEIKANVNSTVESGEQDDDLEEFETGLYLCRWPNGDFSLVKADGRKDAVVQLDEWAGAEPAWLVPVDTCMIDFRLSDRGQLELAEFGEETEDFIWEKCYPELDEVLSSSDVRNLSGKRQREAANKIRRAVEHERKRLWHLQRERTPARTAMGRELQKRLGTVGPVADRYVEIAADEILRTRSGEKGKPN